MKLYGNINIRFTLSVVLADCGGLLLFGALHCKVFVLYVLSPVKVIEVVFVPDILVMSAGS